MGFSLEHSSQIWLMEIPKELIRNKLQDPISDILNQNFWDGFWGAVPLSSSPGDFDNESGLGNLFLKKK